LGKSNELIGRKAHREDRDEAGRGEKESEMVIKGPKKIKCSGKSEVRHMRINGSILVWYHEVKAGEKKITIDTCDEKSLPKAGRADLTARGRHKRGGRVNARFEFK